MRDFFGSTASEPDRAVATSTRPTNPNSMLATADPESGGPDSSENGTIWNDQWQAWLFWDPTGKRWLRHDTTADRWIPID